MAKVKKSKSLIRKKLVETKSQIDFKPDKFVFLEGRVPRMLSFNLDHEYFCKRLGECRCTLMKVGVVKRSKVNGAESPVFEKRRVSSVVTVFYKKKARIEEAALNVPVIAAAIASKKIRVHA